MKMETILYLSNGEIIERNYVEKIEPKKIIANGIATIVFWNDGTKTVVKLADDDEDDLYNAFCAAFAKKMFGSNSAIKKQIERTYEPSKAEIEAFDKVVNTIKKHFSGLKKQK